MKCPLCGREANSFVQCPEQGTSICDKHCNDCQYFSGYETSIVHCFFRTRPFGGKENGKKTEEGERRNDER